MAKIAQMLSQHSNCNCCGKQASFNELGRRPSGFGPLKSAQAPKRPNTHHGALRPLERRVSERVGISDQRRKSLQHGSESTQETSAQKTLDLLSGENHHAEEVAAEIAEGVAHRSKLEILLVESRMKGTSRDKESLLEECSALKEALYDQLYHLQLHRVHHETVIDEQRKMEIAMQELEMAHGLQAPRTGDPSQLKARILGLKCRQQEYYNMLTIQRDDIVILKKDPRVSFTKEASTERDVFALEARRLQKIIRKLRIIYHKVCSENNEVARLRENIAKLKIKIKNTETNIKNSESIIEQMKKDIEQAKAESLEAQQKTNNAVWKARELESHSLVLQNMRARLREEGINIHKQTSALGEQIRILKKDKADKAIQAALAAQSRADMDAKKSGKKPALKAGKLKEYKTDDSRASSPSSPSSTDLSAVRSSWPSSPATPSISTVDKEFDELRAVYLKAIGKATDTFIENAPGSGSPKSKPHPDIGSSTGDHSQYEKLQGIFEKDISQAEENFIDMMDKVEYGVARRRTRSDAEAEAKRLREQLEALQKHQTDANKWLESLTIELDDKILKVGEYAVDVQDSKTRVKITSPDKTPEALARKKAEEEARRKRAEEEEAARRKKAAAEEEARKEREAEEDQARKEREAEEDQARKKREAEEDQARKKREAEEDLARKKREAEEDQARKMREAEEDQARKKREAEEEEARKKRNAEEEEARKKREAEEAAKRKKDEEAAAARRAAEEAAKKKKDDEEAAKKKDDEGAARRAAEEAAAAAAAKRKKAEEDEAVRRAAEEAAKKGAEFFTEEITGTINENIKEVLEHLETISQTVQQKASSSRTPEVSKKPDEAPDESK